MKPQSQSHFRHHLTVEQVDNPASIARIVLRVGHHHNGSAFFIQIGQEAHYFLSVLRVQVTGRLVGKYHLRIGQVSSSDWKPPHGLSPHAAADLPKAVAGNVSSGGLLPSVPWLPLPCAYVRQPERPYKAKAVRCSRTHSVRLSD